MVAPAMAAGDRVAVNVRPRFINNVLPLFGRITQVEDTNVPPQILWENGSTFVGTEDAVALDANAVFRVDEPTDLAVVQGTYAGKVVRLGGSAVPEMVGLFIDVFVRAPYAGATTEDQDVYVEIALIGPSGPPRFVVFPVASGIQSGAPVAALPFLQSALAIVANESPRYK